jgi:hypothetical protein
VGRRSGEGEEGGEGESQGLGEESREVLKSEDRCLFGGGDEGGGR